MVMYNTAQSSQSGLGGDSHTSHASFDPSPQVSPDQLSGGFGSATTPRPAASNDEAYHPTQHNPRPRKKKAVAQERSKTTRACDICKIKKARCSGTIPCVRCTKHSIQCNYKSSYGRGSPPPPLPAPVSRDNSVPSVENNVSDFSREQRVTFEEPYHPSPPEPRGRVPVEVGYDNQAISSRNSPERGGTDLEGYYLGPTSGITFLNRAWRRLNQEHVSTTPEDLQHTDAHRDVSIFAFGDKPIADFDQDNCQLPSRKRAAEMISKYFDHAVVTYRFLHRQVVDEWCSTLYVMRISLSEPPPRALVSKAAVIFMIFALVTLHEEHNDENIEGESGNITSEQWFGAAQYVLRYETGRPSLEIIQARLIQCLYLISSSRANQCWYTLGTTIHLLIALGIHRKNPHGSARRVGSFLEHECQKRVFWCAYTLDIYFSLMLGRPRTFHSEDVDQEFPRELNDSEITNDGPQPRRGKGDCTHTASILHFKLSKIVGEVSRRVYTIQAVPETTRLEEAERLARELEAWKQEVPPLFSTVRPSSLVPPFGRQSNVLQIAYDHAVIHANRSFLLTNFTDLSKRPDISDEKLQRQVSACVEAATRIVQTVNDLSDDASLLTAFWFTHYCTFCAVFVLYLHIIRQGKLPFEQQSTSGHNDLLESVERCQRNLAHATRQNTPSRRYNIILEELRLEVHRQLHSATNASMPLPQTAPIALPGREAFSMLPPDSEFSSMIEGHFRGPQATFNQNLAADWESLSWPQLDSWAYMSMPDLQTPL